MLPLVCDADSVLLNRDLALHAERQVRRTVEGVLAWGDVREGNGD